MGGGLLVICVGGEGGGGEGGGLCVEPDGSENPAGSVSSCFLSGWEAGDRK